MGSRPFFGVGLAGRLSAYLLDYMAVRSQLPWTATVLPRRDLNDPLAQALTSPVDLASPVVVQDITRRNESEVLKE